jgi:hypothetical protein
MPVCKCGSSNCSLIEFNGTKEGAKKGGLFGAVGGALIGLAGGPIGAIAGAAIGAAGGALIKDSESTDKKGRIIKKYKCNSCGKKFEICPNCGRVLETKSESHKRNNGYDTIKKCSACNNLISSSFHANQNQASNPYMNKAVHAYVNKVKDNINSFND